jgi:hypothetical protein
VNQKTAIAALAITLLLACVTWIALRMPHAASTPQADTGRTWLADLHRTTWTAARFEWAAGVGGGGGGGGGGVSAAELSRAEALDLWLLRTRTDGPAWPIEPARVRGLVRIIADADATPAPPDQVSTLLCTLTLTGADGVRRMLEIRQPVVGGGAVIRFHDGAREISRVASGDLIGAARFDSVASWRIPHAFPDKPADATGLRLSKDSRTLALGRVERRWHITHPFSEHAENDAAAALLGRCAQLHATRLVDGPPEEHSAWINSPRAALTLQRDVRLATDDGDVARYTLVQELLLGPLSGEEGRVLAMVRASLVDPSPGGGASPAVPLWGPMLMVIEGEAFDALGVDALPYARATGLPLATADIGELHLGRPADEHTPGAALRPPAPTELSPPGGGGASRAAFVRAIDGWRRHGLMHAGVSVDASGAAELAAFLTLVCETPADRLWLGEPPGATKVCTLTARGSSGQMTAFAHLLRIDDASGPMLGVRTGPVVRLFGGEGARKALAFLAALVPEEG